MAMVIELYDALKKLGLDDEMARAAAKAVVGAEDKSQLATKSDIADLKIAIADLKADLTWRTVGALVALTAIFSAIVKFT